RPRQRTINRQITQAAHPAITLIHLTTKTRRGIEALGVPKRVLFGQPALRRTPLPHRGAELLLAPRTPSLNEHPIGRRPPGRRPLHLPAEPVQLRRPPLSS